MNVLFLGGGRRVSLIELFTSNYLVDKVVTTDTDLLSPTANKVNKVYKTSYFNSETIIDEVVDIINKEQINTVIPLMDVALNILPEVQERTDCLIFGDRESIDISNDKFKTMEFFIKIGVLTPELKYDYPYFIRKLDGCNSKGAMLIKNDHYEQYYDEEYSLENTIKTKPVSGDEFTIDCFVASSMYFVNARKRIEVRNGEVQKTLSVQNKEVERQAIHICKKLKVMGPITLQCIVEGDSVYWIEVNLRFGGGCILSANTGFNYVEWIYNVLYKKHSSLVDVQKNVLMTRYDNEIFREIT